MHQLFANNVMQASFCASSSAGGLCPNHPWAHASDKMHRGDLATLAPAPSMLGSVLICFLMEEQIEMLLGIPETALHDLKFL